MTRACERRNARGVGSAEREREREAGRLAPWATSPMLALYQFMVLPTQILGLGEGRSELWF